MTLFLCVCVYYYYYYYLPVRLLFIVILFVNDWLVGYIQRVVLGNTMGMMNNMSENLPPTIENLCMLLFCCCFCCCCAGVDSKAPRRRRFQELKIRENSREKYNILEFSRGSFGHLGLFFAPIDLSNCLSMAAPRHDK